MKSIIDKEVWTMWSQYMSLREEGDKRKAHNCLIEFINHLKEYELIDFFSEQFCHKVFDLEENLPISHLLKVEIFYPYLLDGLDKQDPKRLRYLAQLGWDDINSRANIIYKLGIPKKSNLYEALLSLSYEGNPTDEKTITLLLTHHFNTIWYGARMLPKELNLNLDTLKSSLKILEQLLKQIGLTSVNSTIMKNYNYYKKIYNYWEIYANEESNIKFDRWMKKKGIDYNTNEKSFIFNEA